MGAGDTLKVTRKDDSVLILHVLQDIRASNADDFEDEYAELTGGATLIVLDFRAVKYMDSTSIGVLLKCSDMTTRANGTCSLYGMAGRLQQVISVSGLDRVLTFLSEEEAEQYPELHMDLS